jgi:hypothetical protein
MLSATIRAGTWTVLACTAIWSLTRCGIGSRIGVFGMNDRMPSTAINDIMTINIRGLSFLILSVAPKRLVTIFGFNYSLDGSQRFSASDKENLSFSIIIFY